MLVSKSGTVGASSKTRNIIRAGLSSLLIAVMLVSGLAFSAPQQARAAGVVTVCSFFGAGGLASALAGGGLVTFNLSCTIPFPARYTISSPTVIDASGYVVTLSGSGATGLFAVNAGVQLELRKVNLDAGFDTTGGGAIYNKGKVLIYGGNLTNNQAPGANGGAIYNDGGGVEIYGAGLAYNKGGNGGAIYNNAYLLVQSSRLDKNTANYGGAIFTKGQANIINSTLYGNSVGANGGAIFSSSGMLKVQTSTFDNNWSSNGNGGAIYSVSMSSLGLTPQIASSTFVKNKAGNWGGALYLQDTNSQLSNSTLTANSANYGGAVYTYKAKLDTINATLSANASTQPAGGGNIYNNGVSTWVVFRNSILHKPTSGNNCDGVAVTNAGNNIQWPAAAACSGMWTTDPWLMGLAFNGGPTQTMALGTASPAIDNANNAVCAAAPINNRDQRGFPRPTDGNGDGVAVCDIGAFEL